MKKKLNIFNHFNYVYWEKNSIFIIKKELGMIFGRRVSMVPSFGERNILILYLNWSVLDS